MGYKEEMVKIRETESKQSTRKTPKEKPRTLAGSKDYDYSNLGPAKPLKGNNSWS